MNKIIQLFFSVVLLGLVAGLFFVGWEFYVPQNVVGPATVYTIQKGIGVAEIARELKQNGFIANTWSFKLYGLVSGNYGKLQSGPYELSSGMSVAQIVNKLAAGDVVKQKATIVEGWTIAQIASYLASKDFYSPQNFLHAAVAKNWSSQISFLADKPATASLEGYLFPDTYFIVPAESSTAFVQNILENFDKKLTPQLRAEISRQHKSIFDIITMASLLEKEVKTPQDKKIVAGILWKRIAAGVPLQVDASVNYITGKSNPRAALVDTTIDSPYNTYRYTGLPQGPICNPGMDSIMAAIYPQTSDYWYYISDPTTDKTIFSRTLDEQRAAIEKYLH